MAASAVGSNLNGGGWIFGGCEEIILAMMRRSLDRCGVVGAGGMQGAAVGGDELAATGG